MSGLEGLSLQELAELIEARTVEGVPDMEAWPYAAARQCRDARFGNRVLLRGLVEFTSHCRQDCLYCGLRRSNGKAGRYRLTREQIVDCCQQGYRLGFRAFVLQGGEDMAFTDALLCSMVEEIKTRCPGCAVTLSIGERSRGSYRALRRAGADRYVLRHETADPRHFAKLHPAAQTLESRKACLYALRETGFQVGAGFMVGSPGQTPEALARDLLFLQELSPHMVGIGPFLPHHATPFAHQPAGTLGQTLLMVALTRLLLTDALLPATTALASLHPRGRILGLDSGANVVMPNLSPPQVRGDYSIYDNKRATGSEAAEGLSLLTRELEDNGYQPDLTRGDHPDFMSTCR